MKKETLPERKSGDNKPVSAYHRQLDMFDPHSKGMQPHIIVIGAGTIGSWTTLFLTKLGLQDIMSVDDDKVEPHNIANQLYGTNFINVPKVIALDKCTQALSALPVTGIESRFPFPVDVECQVLPNTIIIVTVDSMKARSDIFDWIRKHPFTTQFFIDARTGGEVGRVFAFRPSESAPTEEYAKTLHEDKPTEGMNEEVAKASEVKCTAQSIVDVSVTVAARIVNTVRKYLTNKEFPFETDIDLRNDIWIIQK